jgi:hypothetical protein
MTPALLVETKSDIDSLTRWWRVSEAMNDDHRGGATSWPRQLCAQGGATEGLHMWLDAASLLWPAFMTPWRLAIVACARDSTPPHRRCLAPPLLTPWRLVVPARACDSTSLPPRPRSWLHNASPLWPTLATRCRIAIAVPHTCLNLPPSASTQPYWFDGDRDDLGVKLTI